MTTKETLLEQFTACYDENGWFVALKNAVKDLTAEQANWKTENLDNSIWEILSHLNFYNEAYLKRFKGIDSFIRRATTARLLQARKRFRKRRGKRRLKNLIR